MTQPSNNPQDDMTVDEILWQFARYMKRAMGGREIGGEQLDHEQAKAKLTALISGENVDRLEVIDHTGRAYTKGSIYGSPVKVELSYQDDGRTLKVFVTEGDSK